MDSESPKTLVDGKVFFITHLVIPSASLGPLYSISLPPIKNLRVGYP
jgi:hypothetical protein